MGQNNSDESPNIKLIPDEGEIQIAIAAIDGAVIINFGTPISWFGLEKEQAIEIANTIIEKANTLP